MFTICGLLSPYNQNLDLPVPPCSGTSKYIPLILSCCPNPITPLPCPISMVHSPFPLWWKGDHYPFHNFGFRQRAAIDRARVALAIAAAEVLRRIMRPPALSSLKRAATTWVSVNSSASSSANC